MMVMEMQTHGETVNEDRSACFSFRHDIIRTLTDASKVMVLSDGQCETERKRASL